MHCTEEETETGEVKCVLVKFSSERKELGPVRRVISNKLLNLSEAS